MKNKMKLMMALTIAITAFFSSCSKESPEITSNEAPAQEMSLPEVDAMVNQADDEFVNSEVQGGTEEEAFTIEYDGLPDAYQITESTADELNSGKRDGNARRFRACLGKLELDGDQIAKIRRIFKAYQDCKHDIIVRHASAMKALLIKYNDKRDALVKALRNGRITKEEFEKHMKALRIEFNKAKHELASKARVALKNCYIKMLRGLHSVLTERQWKAFVNCYR